MPHKTPSKLAADVLVHLGVVELVLEELPRHLLPEAGLAGAQGFADIGAVGSGVADEIAVQLAGNGPREPPVHENGPEDAHAHEVVSRLPHSPVHETCLPLGVPASHRLARKASGKVTAGMSKALRAIWL